MDLDNSFREKFDSWILKQAKKKNNNNNSKPMCDEDYNKLISSIKEKRRPTSENVYRRLNRNGYRLRDFLQLCLKEVLCVPLNDVSLFIMSPMKSWIF